MSVDNVVTCAQSATYNFYGIVVSGTGKPLRLLRPLRGTHRRSHEFAPRGQESRSADSGVLPQWNTKRRSSSTTTP
jgi:hypothetical protein